MSEPLVSISVVALVPQVLIPEKDERSELNHWASLLPLMQPRFHVFLLRT